MRSIGPKVTLLFLFLFTAAFTQDRYENVTWYEVVYWDFKPGKAAEAMKIVKDYFHKANKAADWEVVDYQVRIGDYDLVSYFHLSGGTDDLSRKTDPKFPAWQKAFRQLAGGEDKADEIADRWWSLVEYSKTEIVMKVN